MNRCSRSMEKRIYERLSRSDSTMDEFVKNWMEENPDRAEEIIRDYIESKISYYAHPIAEEYEKFIQSQVESEISEHEDEAYHRWKDDR